MQYRITTNPGLEDLCAREIDARLRSEGLSGEIREQPFGLAGNLMLAIEAPEGNSVFPSRVGAILHSLKIAFHVVKHLQMVELPVPVDLSAVLSAVSVVDFPDCGSDHSFRVSSSRTGAHDFTSLDIERETGAVVQRNTGMSVDLEHFDRHIRVDLVHSTLLVGIQTTARGLDKRYTWVYKPRVSLKTVVAQAMLQLGSDSLDNIQHILDPFCGSGTILLEAAHTFPDARIQGFDLFEAAVDGASLNIAHAGLSDRVRVTQADARELRKQLPRGSVDMIVTNPPFGVRLGPRTDFKRLYHQFLSGAAYVLKPGGRLVFLGGRRRHHVVHILKEVRSLSLKHVRVIETGGIYPAVYVMTRLPDRH
ncbi:MAG: methyltransferase [Spirochaetaceae bacterium]